MARSASERLAWLENRRDECEKALTKGAPINSYALDGQSTTKESLMDYLDWLDVRIATVRSQAGTGLAGRKNLVRFVR